MALTRPKTVFLSDADGFLNVVGMIKPHGAGSAPTGWLNCDGSSVLRSTYPGLFALIGTTFGSVDGTHFNVPDMRGRTPVGTGQGAFTSSFANTAVNAGTDQITVTANEHFVTGQKVQISSTGTLPAPLVAATNYFLDVVNSTTISLSTTLALSQNGTDINITTQGTGTHTLTWQNFTSRAIGVVGGEESHAMNITELLGHAHQVVVGPNTGGASAVNGQATSISGNQPNSMTSVGSNNAMNNLQPFIVLNWIIKT